MNSPVRHVFSGLFMISILMFMSCGASHKMINDVMYKDVNFSYRNLQNNGLIVAGMCTDVVNFSPEEQLKYSSTLSNILIEKLPEVSKIHLINPRQLLDTLGRNSYYDMMGDYNQQRELGLKWADSVSTIFPNVQYMLFAYLVNENIFDQSHDQYVDTEDGQEIETEYRKTYYITVEFHLYDLFSQKSVLENSVFNKAEQTETRTTQSGCFESCLGNIVNTIMFGEPAEISREEVFSKIVEKYAKDIANI
jgi:hypothetical protein